MTPKMIDDVIKRSAEKASGCFVDIYQFLYIMVIYFVDVPIC